MMHRSDVLQKVNNYMDEHQMTTPGMQVIVGVSGGADSVCLLALLHRMQLQRALTLTVVHVHHGIRGAEADRDADFVQQLCDQWQIECVTYHKDVPALSELWHMTEEETGRQVRYACFEEVRQARGADAIAVAHHMDDQAETVLFNLCRGSGLRGIGGIQPVRDRIIRPLLCLSREEIEGYLEGQGLSYLTDGTNLEKNYTRNRIRLELIPYLTEHLNAQAVVHMTETAEMAAEAWTYIHAKAQEAYAVICTSKGELSAEGLMACDPVIRKEVLRIWFEAGAGRLKDVTRQHIEQLCALASKPSGKVLSMPYQRVAIHEQGMLRLMSEAAYQARIAVPETVFALDIEIPGVYHTPDGSMELTFSIMNSEENERIPENNCTKWFDYDKIKDGLKLRYRGAGDYMTIAPNYNKKLLRRILIDDKIPKDMRTQICVLAEGDHVLWIPNGRISEAYKVTQQTRRILIVDIKGEDTWKTRSKSY